MTWRRRRTKPKVEDDMSADLQAAKEERLRAERALEATRRKRNEEHTEITIPLAQARREFLTDNHVAEKFVDYLRREA